MTLYLSIAWGKLPLPVYVNLAVLPFVVGILFLVSWCWRAELSPRRQRSA